MGIRFWTIRLYRGINTTSTTEITDAKNNDTGIRSCFMSSTWGAGNDGDGDTIRTNEFVSNVSNTYLDSPNTTTQVRYELYINPAPHLNSSYSVYINRPYNVSDQARPHPISFICAQEIYYP